MFVNVPILSASGILKIKSGLYSLICAIYGGVPAFLTVPDSDSSFTLLELRFAECLASRGSFVDVGRCG